jgi:hypothetical protein
VTDHENTFLQNQLPSNAGKAPAEGRRPRTGGPRTPQGTADNWKKALAHGITSSAPVIPHMEDADAWRRFLQGMRASFRPEGVYEMELVYRLAHLNWRLRRLVRYEVMVTMHHIGTTAFDIALSELHLRRKRGAAYQPDPERVRMTQQMRVVAPERELGKIMRYEAHLHRQAMQVQHELEALQAHRRGEPTHLARLDVSATPMG